ncbi:MAG: TonB-dependent receptor, partial [Salinivirgaceae bacterium]
MKSAILSIALVLTFTITNAQNLINGVVTNKQKEPLSGATIYLQPGNHETVSNEDGQFVFRNLKTGTYLLKVSYIGYKFQEKTIVLDGNKTMNVVLEKQVFQTKEVTISSTRATDKTPTSYTNISKEEISSNRSAQDIPYLLQLTPSVVTTSDAGAGVGYTNFRIRGTDLNRINVTVNDIPLNDAESHGVFFVNMPDFAESTNTIQVQRGVGTSTNGAAAFGASVNFQTNDIEVSPYAEVNNAFGSFNTQKNTFKAGTGLINGVYSFDARLSRIKSDGFIDRASSDLKSFFASGTYRGDKNIVRVNIFSGKERTYQAWEGIPKAKLDGDSAAMMDFALNSGYSQEEIDNLFDSDARTFNRYLYDNQTDNYQQDHYQVFYTRTISKNITANAAYHQTNGFGYYESYKYNKKIVDFDADNIVMSNDTITRSDVVIRKYLDNIFYGGVGSVKFNYETLKATVGGGWNRYDGDHFGEITWAQNSIG